MDHFGIGAAMRGMLLNYMQGSRRTGRTTSLVESVKDGDRIVFADSQEAERVERILKERGVRVQCIVIDPRERRRLKEHGRLAGDGRTIFDHGWVELFYVDAIEDVRETIDRLQQETSGNGYFRETARQIEEIARWE